MRPIDIGSIIVAVVAALGAWASQRAAAKATTFNTAVTTRLDAEKEAYERARAFDIETINRQEKELESLRKENDRLRSIIEDLQNDNSKVHEELRMLRLRVNKLERGFPKSLEEMLRERLDEESSSGEEQRNL